MARSRRLAVYWGILGLADSRKRSLHEPVSTRQGKFFFGFFFFGFFFFRARFWTGRFLMGKTINVRFANKELRPSGICLGATWAGIFCYTEIADLWRLGFIYTEFADAWRLDFIYTEIADTNWSLGDSRGDDIAFVSSQVQAKFRRRFRVVFS